jgi:DNA-binding response OmpR family regulator
MQRFHVQVASDGAKALEMITCQPPAVVVLDLRSLKVDGWEV